MRRAIWSGLIILLALQILAAFGLAAGPEVKFVDQDTLKSWLGDPNVLILDVRVPSYWNRSATKIKGAVRQDPGRKEVAVWGRSLPPGKKIVVY